MNAERKSSAGLGAIRIIVITVAVAMLAFLVALFLAIVGILLVSMMRGGGIDMTMAYRVFALPVAITAGVVALAAAIISERRSGRVKPRREYQRAA